jgi:peptide chain release factor subunit 1
MGAVNDLTEDILRELAGTRADESTVLSIYLDLDPAQFPTARARSSEIDSLLDDAHRQISSGERSHAELLALRAALARAEELLTGNHSWAQGARAVALFICQPLGLERLLRLPHPVARAALINSAPFIAPLAGPGPVGRVCVALVDERFARILRGSSERLEEAVSFGDDVHGRQKQGGWSQARYQRSRHEDVEHHLRRIARILMDLLRVSAYDKLLIACTSQLWPRVVDKLHADVRERLDPHRLSLDVGDVGIEDVVRAVGPQLAAEERAHEDGVLAELREHLSRNSRAAVGLDAVLDALVQRRVEVLLYDPDLPARGVVCPRCGWMGGAGERCPLDGTALEARESMLEDAVESAVSQSAEVLPLRGRPELAPLGGIAATLRF